VRCESGTAIAHRPSIDDCWSGIDPLSGPTPIGPPWPDGSVMATCRTNGDCTAAPHGYCQTSGGYVFGGAPTVSCQYGCVRDSECQPPSGALLSVAAGEATTCAIRLDGTLACWGAWQRRAAVVRTSTAVAKRSRRQVPFPQCPIRTNGKVARWGSNTGAAPLLPEICNDGSVRTPLADRSRVPCRNRDRHPCQHVGDGVHRGTRLL